MFLVFFTVALLVLGGVHFYFYRRLVVATALPAPWRLVAAVTFGLLTLGFPISFFVTRLVSPETGRLLLYPIYTWLGVMMMLFFVLLGLDLVRGATWLAGWISGKGLDLDPSRRLLMARVAAGAASGLVSVASVYGVRRGVGQPIIRRVKVLLPGLPAGLEGLTIVQLSDVHLGAMRRGRWLERVVQRTNALKPHIIAITGDLADTVPEMLPAEVANLGKLRAEGGVFFVTGNHEYFHDLEGWLGALSSQGVRVLRNERVTVRRGGAALDVAGVDDHDGGRMTPGHGPDVARALDGRPKERKVLLLAHQPKVIDDAARHGVDLVLCGHTHGGQIMPWGTLVGLQQPYVRGLHHHQGRTWIYVSEGTGFWGPPMRVGSTSEITLLTLTGAG